MTFTSPVCRICHGIVTETCSSVQLNCKCLGELGLLHTDCARAWFSVSRTSNCDVCCFPVTNVPFVKVELPHETAVPTQPTNRLHPAEVILFFLALVCMDVLANRPPVILPDAYVYSIFFSFPAMYLSAYYFYKGDARKKVVATTFVGFTMTVWSIIFIYISSGTRLTLASNILVSLEQITWMFVLCSVFTLGKKWIQKWIHDAGADETVV